MEDCGEREPHALSSAQLAASSLVRASAVLSAPDVRIAATFTAGPAV
jgi:hypothetical protein